MSCTTDGSARCGRRCHVDIAGAMLSLAACGSPLRSRLHARIPCLEHHRRRSIMRSLLSSKVSLLSPEPMSAELIVQCCEKFSLSLYELEAVVVCEMGLDATFGCRDEFEALIGAHCAGWQGTAGGLWQIECEIAVEDMFGSGHTLAGRVGWVARTFVRMPATSGGSDRLMSPGGDCAFAAKLGPTTVWASERIPVPVSSRSADREDASCRQPTAPRVSSRDSMQEATLGYVATSQHEDSATAIVPAPELARLQMGVASRWQGLPARCTFRSATWVQLLDGTVQAMLTTDENPTVRCLHEALVCKCFVDGLRYIAWSPERHRYLSPDRRHQFYFLAWIGKQVKFNEIWIREVLCFLSC
mmetsp:Transcript_62648/g.144252  ORF Transcript_62648/g.144252 Transcript_62648/m.144252 type:complete len:358 (+) Transcript_62648:194-1267(+)